MCSTVVTTAVTFAELSDAWIDWYVGTGEPLDKAGGYGMQGSAALFVARIDGSPTNVIGLPLDALAAARPTAVPARLSSPFSEPASGGAGATSSMLVAVGVDQLQRRLAQLVDDARVLDADGGEVVGPRLQRLAVGHRRRPCGRPARSTGRAARPDRSR